MPSFNRYKIEVFPAVYQNVFLVLELDTLFSIEHKAIDWLNHQFTGATYRTVIEAENKNSDFLLAKQGGNETRESVAHDLIDRLVVMFVSRQSTWNAVSYCQATQRTSTLALAFLDG